ncbi:hypothetical protein [Leifsonia xyli]|uniref:hypothetical protein n=1 Tax=Leifsonia xyli TaxID=1575 RepID=UPI000417FECD|nr:hypothetical protein [Leifsonia xyli]
MAATPTTSAVAAGDRRDVTEPSAPDVVAVRLSPTPDAAAFLSGPLTVREGEVLLVDAGVVLYASRNPADYQVDDHPACGTISKKGVGQHGVRD